MQMKRHDMTVRQIVELYKNGMLRANPEYQRGTVWSITQRKKLIDSVMRGYPLPLIYLHHIKKQVAGMQREDLEIIDGQQRILSLADFAQQYTASDRSNGVREATSTDFAIAQDGPDGLDLGQGAVIYVGEELYLFLSEGDKVDKTPAAVAEVREDGLYLYGKRIESSGGSILQSAMKIVQAEKNHRNSKGELISLSAWRQWHVLRDGKFVRIFDIKDPALARGRRSPERY